MKIEFTNPLALLLLVLVPAAIYLARHSLANLSRRRQGASLAARLLILLLLVLALAGLRLRATSNDLAVLFLVDVSASVAPDQKQQVIEQINAEIARAAPADYLGIVAFGKDAAVELAPTRKEMLGDWRLTEINSAPTRDYTNLAGALKLAAALVPETAVGRLVLFSDGNENLENALAEAPLLRAQNIEVHTRSLATVNDGARRQGEIAVRELVAPQMLAEGEAFELRATVDSTVDTEAKLRIFRNDSLLAERDVQLVGGGENVFVLSERNDRKGFYSYRAEIAAPLADSFVQNNAREAFALVEGKPKLLYVTGDAAPSAALLRVFQEGGFFAEVSRAVPTSLAGFQDFDLVIFDNVAATRLSKAQMQMAQSYVKDLGGGFLMIGGEQSFGPGGYYKTPIEQLLPVSLDVRQKKHFPSLGLAIVIDKSGSMGQSDFGQSKMQLALEAASTAVDFLSERDFVTVITFDSAAQTVVSLQKVEDKKRIIADIQAIEMGGGTSMYPGIRQGYEALLASEAQIKHLIVLSDGQSEGGDFPGIARAVRDAGMTLTAVAVGTDSDQQTMKQIADLGGGRFYFTDRADTLPQIFTREAFLASRSTIIEEPFQPRLVRETQATKGIDWAAAPMLGGYVGTAERDATNSPAITSLVSHKDDPVYAVWQYGLGRAAAFTSDAKGRWALGWMNWSGFGQFWTQVLRDTIRREGATDLLPRVEIHAGKGHVTVEAVTPDGGFKNNLRLQAHIVAPDFTTLDIPLEQTASGRYEGDFAATARGAYLVSVRAEGGEAAPITGSVNSYSPEFQIASADANLLAELSEATDGTARLATALTTTSNASDAGEARANLFERRAEKTTPQEIFTTLVLLALLLLPVDVGIRRLNISRERLAEGREWLASRLRRPASSGDAETAMAHAQLKRSRGHLRFGEAGAAAELTDTPAGLSTPQTPKAPAAEAAFISEDRLTVLRQKETERRIKEAAAREAAKTAPSSETRESADAAPTEEVSPLASRLLNARRKRRE